MAEPTADAPGATPLSAAREVEVDEQAHPCRRPDVETAILPDGSCLLFDPLANNGHALNATSALIWDYCDGALSAGAIADEMAQLLPDDAEMRPQALAMIATFQRLGLLVSQA